ncbi:sigma-54 dependent transcriptional regulator [Clostridium sp. CM027]|uniref:sigma-54 interaction domain-containing protein n=1 Tax=Clostridium sp. CM027 TaxID=2849865 RepID=UPI001C6EB97A|nr:sigma-54 dependent transcriptional regulator [Clostridium sp. CM027]MBW9147168.1 sigma-54 dependent transcriptional regulator [Clostridium sp. CM027]UVE39540.1 sigma-54 dependent transcriptional regulator [Clostridium sp. CM027]
MSGSLDNIEEKTAERIKNDIFNISKMIIEDNNMIEVIKMANKVSRVNTTVLVQGETGVGKEGIAKYIHYNSLRKKESFVVINCGAIPKNLIESVLFGYEAGAFTGANKQGKIGLFELADKGTIFLDEVGELSQEAQVELLRVVQEHEIERIGGLKTVKVDVRIIAATNKNLKEMIKKNLFREDLYYRLSVFPINIPPLRERNGDIVPLIKFFMEEINEMYGLKSYFSDEALDCLKAYSWPGNIRELKNIVERSLVMSDNKIIITKYLPKYIRKSYKRNEIEFSISNLSIKGHNLKDIIRIIEEEIIDDAMRRYGNIRMAAKALGVNPSTLVRKRQKYNK